MFCRFSFFTTIVRRFQQRAHVVGDCLRRCIVDASHARHATCVSVVSVGLVSAGRCGFALLCCSIFFLIRRFYCLSLSGLFLIRLFLVVRHQGARACGVVCRIPRRDEHSSTKRKVHRSSPSDMEYYRDTQPSHTGERNVVFIYIVSLRNRSLRRRWIRSILLAKAAVANSCTCIHRCRPTRAKSHKSNNGL